MHAAEMDGIVMQVKELAAQVLPVELAALSAEPPRPADEALPALETHQVRCRLDLTFLCSPA